MTALARRLSRLPRPRRLGWLLVASHVGLVLLLALLLLLAGAGTIRAAIQQRAQAQATQAASEGLVRLGDQRRDVAVVAGLLAERPTLQRYLQRGQRTAAIEFLDAFLETSQVDYLRVERDGAVFAETGMLPPDPTLPGLQPDPRDGAFWLVDAAPLAALPDTRVLVARRLPDGAVAPGEPGDERVDLLPVGEATDARLGTGRVRTAYRHVYATGVGETVGRTDAHAAMRIEPVRGPDGGADALLVASIPRSATTRDIAAWLGAFALVTLLAASVAAAMAIWLARRIAQPFATLAHAAERLGVGDLETPVDTPPTGLREPVALARNLEGMRRQLRQATGRERAQRQELDAVLDGVEDGIVALDAARHVRYANRAFLALLDRPEADVVGAPFDDLLGEQARTLVIRPSREVEGRRVVIVREPTSTEVARAMRDAVVANLSHEFQTPLAAQVASIELLVDHLRRSGDETALRLAEAQSRGALRLSQLVENLLDSVRIESGEMRLRREPVDLRAEVLAAVDLMRPLIAQRDQQVAMDLPTSDRVLLGDPRRLSQVAVNLLANANKFAPDQSTIRVGLVWGEETVSLWVEDEGPGLPPLARRADLFAPFRRAPGEDPSQRGTGLGLAIVRALVERHHGEVVLAASPHGKGARFGIVLPLEPRA